MKNIMKLAKLAKNVTNEELGDATAMAQDQLDYINPLKNGTAMRQHALGEYNMKVINKIRELRDVITSGETLC